MRNRGGRRLQLKCIKLKLAKTQGGEMPPSNPLEKTLIWMPLTTQGVLEKFRAIAMDERCMNGKS